MQTMDEQAFEGLAQRHRRELHVHCYRMVASFSDADDLVQEALLRAWNARDTFDASDIGTGARAWLYRIATNVCLDFLRRARRQASRLESLADLPWIEPYPDRWLDAALAPGTPEDAVLQRETITLAYLALIQRLPARQRAVLILRDVLGWSAADAASALGMTVAAANSGLQRARATLQAAAPARHDAPTGRERELLAGFIDAHERGDAVGAVALMREDIRVTMPPRSLCFESRAAVQPLLDQAFAGGMGEWRLRAAWANRQPAAVSYLRRPGDSVFRAFKVDVLRIQEGLIAEVTTFDPTRLAEFGLPPTLVMP